VNASPRGKPPPRDAGDDLPELPAKALDHEFTAKRHADARIAAERLA
jgi:hypothetical protein